MYNFILSIPHPTVVIDPVTEVAQSERDSEKRRESGVSEIELVSIVLPRVESGQTNHFAYLLYIIQYI